MHCSRIFYYKNHETHMYNFFKPTLISSLLMYGMKTIEITKNISCVVQNRYLNVLQRFVRIPHICLWTKYNQDFII